MHSGMVHSLDTNIILISDELIPGELLNVDDNAESCRQAIVRHSDASTLCKSFYHLQNC